MTIHSLEQITTQHFKQGEVYTIFSTTTDYIDKLKEDFVKQVKIQNDNDIIYNSLHINVTGEDFTILEEKGEVTINIPTLSEDNIVISLNRIAIRDSYKLTFNIITSIFISCDDTSKIIITPHELKEKAKSFNVPIMLYIKLSRDVKTATNELRDDSKPIKRSLASDFMKNSKSYTIDTGGTVREYVNEDKGLKALSPILRELYSIPIWETCNNTTLTELISTDFEVEFPDELKLSNDQKSRYQHIMNGNSAIAKDGYIWFQWERPYANELTDVISTWMAKQDFRYNGQKIMATIAVEEGILSERRKFYIYPVKVTYSGAYFIVIYDNIS